MFKGKTLLHFTKLFLLQFKFKAKANLKISTHFELIDHPKYYQPTYLKPGHPSTIIPC